MGAGVAFVFAALFLDQVDMLINIDWLKPWIYPSHKIIEEYQTLLEKYQTVDDRNKDVREPPAYTLGKLAEKLFVASHGSVTKNFALYLLERQIAPSKKHPGKFYLTKDARMNYSLGINLSQSVYEDLARELKMPFLYIKAILNSSWYETEENITNILGILKAKNSKFEHRIVDSACHHLYLVEPEKISGIIYDFMRKHSNKT